MFFLISNCIINKNYIYCHLKIKYFGDKVLFAAYLAKFTTPNNLGEEISK